MKVEYRGSKIPIPAEVKALENKINEKQKEKKEFKEIKESSESMSTCPENGRNTE